MSHGGPPVRTVPRVVNLPHVDQELLHLSYIQGSADHHLKMDVNKVIERVNAVITSLITFPWQFN